MKKENIIHPLQPIYTKESSVLILGSIPSKKSREEHFYYAHPKNRFWKVITKIFHEKEKKTSEEKIDFLKRHHIALWDVICSCDINGSSDASISNVKANDLNKIITKSHIKYIITNGKTAKKYYDKYCLKNTKINAICLASTSPANAKKKEEDLIKEYQILKNLLKEK